MAASLGSTQPGRYDSLESYRAYVRASIERAVETIAQITFGDIRNLPEFDELDDDEFADLYAGFSVLASDIVEAAAMREEQIAASQLRTELWRAAMDTYESHEPFVGTLLELVGPRMEADRVSFFSTGDTPRAEAVRTCQWCAARVEPTPDVRLPHTIWRQFATPEPIELRRSFLKLPEQELVRIAMDRTGAAAGLCIMCGPTEAPHGFVVLSDPAEHRVWTGAQKALLREIANIITGKLNQMRAENALRAANARLEFDVAKRTEELSVANQRLQEDISKRIKAEKALREREELYRRLVETSPDAIIVCAPGGGIVMANSAAATLFALRTPEDLMGMSYTELIAPSEREAIGAKWGSLSETNPLLTVECRFVRSDSSSFLAESRTVVVGDASAPAGTLSIIRDITDRRRREEEVFRAQKLESLGILAGGIAHDFNNVLTGIVSNLALVRTGLDSQPDLQQAIADAEEAALRATGLTKQLLTFAKGGEPIRAPEPIRELLEGAVRFCLSGSRIKYTIDAPHEVLPVLVDRGQIDQVLNNVLINAVQAMGGEGAVSIAVRNQRVAPLETGQLAPGEYVRVRIRDSGPGIPVEHFNRVFDPYYTTKRDGIGLGLTTVYSIVRRHGGAVWCESRPGEGATFTFLLPATREAVLPKTPRGNGKLRPGIRVLVMDDDRTVRMVMERLLRGAGCSTTITTNSAEAVRVYQAALDKGEPFEAVLLDLTIPGDEGGQATLQKLKELDPSVSAAVVSGYSNDPIMSDYQAHGFKAMLAKPFRVSELVRTVAALVGENAS
jgi:PAS domain S-box-containing protein